MLAPTGEAGSSASLLGEAVGGDNTSGWKRTEAGLVAALVGRMFSLPLIVTLGDAQL